MKAYKFRSVEPFEYILDILNNRRLYCATTKQLNDPMEGYYFSEGIPFVGYTPEQQALSANVKEKTDEIRAGFRICSLTRDYKNHCLWAYYADNFRGVAIEISLPDKNPQITPVTYDKRPHTGNGIDQDPYLRARYQLSCKCKDWAHEGEIRIITNIPYFEVEITCVILGLMIKKEIKAVLKEICYSRGIPLKEMKIDGADDDTIKLKALN